MNPKNMNEFANEMILRMNKIFMNIQEETSRLEKLETTVRNFRDELRGRNFDKEAAGKFVKKYWTVQQKQSVWENNKKVWEGDWEHISNIRKCKTRDDAREVAKLFRERENQHVESYINLHGEFSGSYYDFRIVWRPVEELGVWRPL